jgi:hypothetical protein
MGTKAFTALVCGFAIAGQMRAQEVVVARETKPKAPARGESASQQSRSGSGDTPTAKARVHGKKPASTLPTVEQMRMAGALAGERLKDQAPVEAASARRESSSQTAKSEAVPAESVRKEKRVEQSSTPRRSKLGTTKLDGVAPVRPTMIEAQKEETDSSQPAQSGPRGRQTSVPQTTNGSQL